MPKSFRGQLIAALIPLAVLVATTVLTAMIGVWPAAVLQAAFVLTWTTRVIVLFRLRQRGAFPTDASTRPPDPLLNLEYLLVLRVQLTAWILAGIYFAVIHFWWGILLAAFLAYITLPLTQLLHRKARDHTTNQSPDSPNR
ncbi:hypothetical protein EV138_3719 [Kribbella voronezhensis]|uniref:Uncharacterized protein n=1 Tax=Kribbella voronezhensis TaxID=2512212 RepID=A0A4R7TDH1_9ACTN|nr:hypothetical protein [Kribbella voronezhensis]TDU90135.1 hypothetical protein EV138_3719 [Kribbella voronezhensis]